MSDRTEQAVLLMTQFAERTGLTARGRDQRYLWTDAFAVCNWLGLSRVTGEWYQTELALQLIDRVHRTLGRHRPDDRRSGWISGLDDAEGEAHPTRGGLRIGKPLMERAPDEPIDERLEWERDGQYFHYLTKWMHALNQAARHTGQLVFNGWAVEMAQTAHRAFTYEPCHRRRVRRIATETSRKVPDISEVPDQSPYGGPKRMYWKLSIDLSRPLVASMGQHDALDGLITCAQIQATATAPVPALADAITDFAAMVDPQGLATADPLGLGGLLVDAYRLAQLVHHGAAHDFGLIEPLLEAALTGLQRCINGPELRLAAGRRLAFRELGLAIGLAVLERDEWLALSTTIGAAVERLLPFRRLRDQIEQFWLLPQHRGVDSWLEHANINDVMLATCLEPTGVLVIPAAPRS